MTNNSTDTPLDACPHCGAEIRALLDDPYPEIKEYRCGTVNFHPSDLCQEREARQKAEAEVEILTARLKRSIEIQDEMCTGCRCYHCDDLRMELSTLNPTTR